MGRVHVPNVELLLRDVVIILTCQVGNYVRSFAMRTGAFFRMTSTRSLTSLQTLISQANLKLTSSLNYRHYRSPHFHEIGRNWSLHLLSPLHETSFKVLHSPPSFSLSLFSSPIGGGSPQRAQVHIHTTKLSLAVLATVC